VLGWSWRAVPTPVLVEFSQDQIEQLAELEHRRWTHFQYRNGRPGHQWAKPWAELTEDVKEHDRNVVRMVPSLLLQAGLEIDRRDVEQRGAAAEQPAGPPGM
jgi:hypothetical protein